MTRWPPWIGPLRMGGPMRLSVAGAESTVAVGVARLGGSAHWIGVVGDDEIDAHASTYIEQVG